MNFDETNHEYTHEGDKYISVTTLIKKHGLSVDYADIPEEVLKKAAARGTAVHKAFENYIKSNGVTLPNHDELGEIEVNQLRSIIANRNIDLSLCKSEQIVFDTLYKVAGTIDWIYFDNDTMCIADFKTTSSIHYDTVAWQLSIYNYMVCEGDLIQYYSNKLYVYQFYKGKLTIREIAPIEYQDIINLLSAEKNGVIFQYTPDNTKILSLSESQVIANLLKEKEMHKRIIDELDNKLEVLQAPILTRMKNNLQMKIKIGDISITRTERTGTRSFDINKAKRFLERNNENIDDYYKVSNPSSSISIKLNN